MEATQMDADTSEEAMQPQAFKTDAAISTSSMFGKERELEKWVDKANPDIEGEELVKVPGEQPWDQFHGNAQFGLKTTYDENLYTTKLDVNAIPLEKQEEAARIAKEIEDGPTYETQLQDEDGVDEEAKFGAVLGTGAYKDARRKADSKDDTETKKPEKDKPVDGGSSIRLSEDALAQHEAMQSLYASGDFVAQHRAKRNLITSHQRSPLLHSHAPMVSEMKGINALNLEPALPKVDDKTNREFMNFKNSQNRSQSRAVDLKADFTNALKQLKDRESKQQEFPKEPQAIPSGSPLESDEDAFSRKRGAKTEIDTRPSPTLGPRAAPLSRIPPTGQAHKGVESKKIEKVDSFGFQFNANAASFTPGSNTPPDEPRGQAAGHSSQGGGARGDAPISGQGGAPQRMQDQGPKSQVPTFSTLQKDAVTKSINKLLIDFCEKVINNANEKCEQVSPEWTEARGASYKEILGTPSQNETTMQHVFSSFGAYGGPDMSANQVHHGGFQNFGMDNQQLGFNHNQPGPPISNHQNLPMNAMMDRGDGMMMGQVPNQPGSMFMPSRGGPTVNDNSGYGGDMPNHSMQPMHPGSMQNQPGMVPNANRGQTPMMMAQQHAYLAPFPPMNSIPMSMMPTSHAFVPQRPPGHQGRDM